MTTIRRFCCNDLLHLPVMNLCIKGRVTIPVIAHMMLWPQCFLVAEAPGKQIMGYIYGSAKIYGQRLYGSIDQSSISRLYEDLKPLKDLISTLEKILFSYNEDLCYIEADQHVYCMKTIQMYYECGYKGRVPGINPGVIAMCKMKKGTITETGVEAASTSVPAVQSQGTESIVCVSNEESAVARARSSTSAPAVESLRAPRRGSTSTSAPAVESRRGPRRGSASTSAPTQSQGAESIMYVRGTESAVDQASVYASTSPSAVESRDMDEVTGAVAYDGSTSD